MVTDSIQFQSLAVCKCKILGIDEQRRKKEELEAMLRQREESFIVALDVFIDAAPARTWHGKPIGLKTIQHYKHLLQTISKADFPRRFGDGYIEKHCRKWPLCEEKIWYMRSLPL